MRKIIFIFFIFVPAAALAGEKLTIAKCVDDALQKNELIKISEYGILKAHGVRNEMFGHFFPSVSVYASYTKMPKVPSFGGFSMGSEDNYLARISATQPVFAWGKILNGYRMARCGERLAEANLEKTRGNVVFNVKKLFYTVILSKRLFEISKETKDVMKDHFETTQRLYVEGKASQLDVSRAKVQMINAETDALKAKSGMELAKKNLLNAIGYDSSSGVEIEGDLKEIEIPDENLSSLEETALLHRPEMREISERKTMSQILLKLARAQNRPSVSVIYNYEYSKPFQYFENRWAGSWNFDAFLNFPIFSGLSNFAKASQAKAEISQVAEREKLLRKEIKLEVEKAYLDRENAFERVKTQKENVSAARENFEIMKKRFSLGLVSDIELRDTQLALSRAEVEYVTALYDLNVAAAELEKVLGKDNE